MRNLITKKLAGKEFFGHPSGLYVLFLTEMWERFSYYGMRALLILYMTKYLLADPGKAGMVWGYPGLEAVLIKVFGKMSIQQVSSQIYGLYTGFVYFTPFFGGMLADRLFGQRRTVYLGGTLMAIGHFLMANERMFLLALLFLILGNGCFKPNISTQVGSLYKEGDPRRDGAFTIFYMGINLGAFFSPLVCGTLGQTVGWHYGFGAAGVGMMCGLGIYWLGSGLLPKSVIVAKQALKEGTQVASLTRKDWYAVIALGVLCFLNIMFWSVYEQQGNTLQLWADERTDWMIFGWQMPSTWYQSFNAAMIVAFAPLLNNFWRWQNARSKEPSSVAKMGMGCLMLGLAFLPMVLVARITPEGARASVLWLVALTYIVTMGELYLSPIGLSLVTKVAPKKILSTMMGMWFLSSFFGNYMTGYIGTYYDKMSKENFFIMLTVIAVTTGVIFVLLKRPLEKVIGKHI